jgi:hypothetical protein
MLPDDVDDYDANDDFAKSLEVAYAAIRERMAAGGAGWAPRVSGGPPLRARRYRQPRPENADQTLTPKADPGYIGCVTRRRLKWLASRSASAR